MVEENLPKLQDASELFGRILSAFHETALREGHACTLAFYLIFPNSQMIDHQPHYLSMGGCIGDACAYVVRPDLQICDLNPVSPERLARDGHGLGNLLNRKSAEELQSSFWWGFIPVGSMLICGSDGLGDHFDSKTLKITPTPQDLGIETEEMVKYSSQELSQKYREKLVQTLLKKEENLTAKTAADALMKHCLDSSEELRSQYGKQDTNHLPGKIDDISIVALHFMGIPNEVQAMEASELEEEEEDTFPSRAIESGEGKEMDWGA